MDPRMKMATNSLDSGRPRATPPPFNAEQRPDTGNAPMITVARKPEVQRRDPAWRSKTSLNARNGENAIPRTSIHGAPATVHRTHKRSSSSPASRRSRARLRRADASFAAVAATPDAAGIS